MAKANNTTLVEATNYVIASKASRSFGEQHLAALDYPSSSGFFCAGFGRDEFHLWSQDR